MEPSCGTFNSASRWCELKRKRDLIDLEPSWACAFLASQQKRLSNFLGEIEEERETC